MNKSRTGIRDIVSEIRPHDHEEQVLLREVLRRIDNEAELVFKNAPSKQFVTYFVLVDYARKSLLLVDHIKAKLWLPPGGHVERDETPHATAVRELAEELGPRAAMVSTVGSIPLFVSQGETRGSGRHTDISLWYVVSADEQMWLDPDPGEFAGYKWMSLEQVLSADISELDPGMHRFVQKLQGRL